MTEVATNLYRPAGSLAADGWSVVLTPESAGWHFSGLRVGALEPGGSLAFDTAGDEVAVLPLEGGFDVVADGERYRLSGRLSVWAGPSDFLYAPPSTSIQVESAAGGRFAVATARAEPGYPVRHVAASAVGIELRGAGVSSREVRNFARPDGFDADRLIAVEVLSPGGNWGSYPPHKHDEMREDETELEEIYHYVVADGPAGPGLAYQHVYGTPARPIELLTRVRTGDVVLVPHGWHGPAMAAPGYDLYYLNVMAGPGERAWRACDDPAHAWVRATWAEGAVDPRLPFGRNGSA
ncbi:MAG: Myo-inositol catabolism IolB domain protein [Chloroflexota bacterium]|nr:Myo-inositol catabolism IolB domain protein [Chloroflexota bacterium]